MKEIAKLLREAYKAIQEADTSSIDAYYLAVEEAQGFIAEALDLAEGVDYTEEVKLYDEAGNYMGMMGGHEVQK